MPTTPAFSVVCIARNESKTLPRLAESLKEFLGRGGEWLIIDTGSSDGTPDVARSLGAKVSSEGDRFVTVIDAPLADQINAAVLVGPDAPVVQAGDRLFDFSKSRNYAASLAAHDWIFMPDCDEAYTMFKLEEIEQAIANPQIGKLEYEFCYCHLPDGKPWVEFRHSKAYRRSAFEWCQIIHEILKPLTDPVMVTQYLPPTIMKLEHFQNHTSDRAGYLRGLAYDTFHRPGDDRAAHYFARELYYTKRYRSSIRAFERHIAMNGWLEERAQSWNFMGDCHAWLGEEEKAIDCYLTAFRLDPTRRESLIRLAEHFYRKKDAQRTACYAAAALQIPYRPFYANDMRHYRDLPHQILYWAQWWIGDRKGSYENWKRALELAPHDPRYQTDAQFYQQFIPAPQQPKPAIAKKPCPYRFSLTHATARVDAESPVAWGKAMRAWLDACDHPEAVEYVVSVHHSRIAEFYQQFWANTLGRTSEWGKFTVVRNTGADSNASQVNLVNAASTGQVIVGVMDDLFPCPHWDTQVLEAIGDPEAECLLHVSSGSTRDQEPLINAGAITRAYYERLGGTVIHPSYDGMYGESELTYFAYQRDKVVKQRFDILFEHRHPSFGKGEWDDIYRRHNRPEAYQQGRENFERRKAAGFPA